MLRCEYNNLKNNCGEVNIKNIAIGGIIVILVTIIIIILREKLCEYEMFRIPLRC